MCLCFGFVEFSGKNNWKEIIDCKSSVWGLASGQSSSMIIGLLLNTGAKYGVFMKFLHASIETISHGLSGELLKTTPIKSIKSKKS